MPKSNSTISGQADDDLSDPSVLDFLYHDSRRIGSFLSQFEGDGHLQQLTRTKDGSRGKKQSSARDVKGNAGIASGKLHGGTETVLEMAEGYARVFDPYWANARAFLDYLSDHNMLQRDITMAQIGQFVIAKGWLSILDLAMFKSAWKLPAIQRQIQSGAVSSKPLSQMTAAEKNAHREQKQNTELMIEMMQILPHSVHATLLTSGDITALVWCSLKEEYLVTPASDLTLAHGAQLSGQWSILGILSASPEYSTPNLANSEQDAVPGMMQSVVGQVSKTLAPIVRVALGRPAAASAVTPLLIFREVI